MVLDSMHCPLAGESLGPFPFLAGLYRISLGTADVLIIFWDVSDFFHFTLLLVIIFAIVYSKQRYT